VASADGGSPPPPPNHGANGPQGGTAIGLIAVNNALNDNNVASNNATNVCLVAACQAGTLQHNEGPSHTTRAYCHGGCSYTGGTAIGAVALNNVANNNNVLSNNATNVCAVSACQAGAAQTSSGPSGRSGGTAIGGVAVNNALNNNNVLSNNATNVCLVAACQAGAAQIEYSRCHSGCNDNHAPPAAASGRETGMRCQTGCEPPHQPQHQPGTGGTAIGLVAANNVLNDNNVLSNNATNVCLVALCQAGAAQINGAPHCQASCNNNHSQPAPASGRETSTRCQTGCDHHQPHPGTGGTAIGLVAANNVLNNNNVLSNNATNFCAVALCQAGAAQINSGHGGSGNGGTAIGLVAANNVLNNNNVLSNNATNVCAVAGCQAGTLQYNGGRAVRR
jgi:hypothetical protein